MALSLKEDNADLLFNTAQVLASSAELLAQEEDLECKLRARDYVLEAASLFAACLSRQELDYTQQQSLFQDPAAFSQDLSNSQRPEAFITGDQNQTGNLPSGEAFGAVAQSLAVQDTKTYASVQMRDAETSVSGMDTGEWATIVEPVQPSDMFDTAISYLEILTSALDLCISLEPEHSNENALINLGETLITQRLMGFANLLPETITQEDETPAMPYLSIATGSMQVDQPSQPSNPRAEAYQRVLFKIARFNSSKAQVLYKRKLCNVLYFSNVLQNSFEPLDKGIDTAITVRVAHAEELLEFATAIRERFLDSHDSVDSRRDIAYFYCVGLQRAQQQTQMAITDLEAGRNLHFPGQDTPVGSDILELAGDIALLLYWIMISEEVNPELKQGFENHHNKALSAYHRAGEHAMKEGRSGHGEEVPGQGGSCADLARGPR